MGSAFRDVHSTLVRSVAPVGDVVSRAEAKAHCRIDGTDEDDLVDDLIAAAVEQLETDAEMALLPQTHVLRLDEFPDEVELRMPPIRAVSSVSYVDAAGDSQTLAASGYDTDLAGFPGRVVKAYGTAWPTTRDVVNAVTVTFTAGYDDADAVPQLAKHAVLLLVGHWFENREAFASKALHEVGLAYSSIVRRLRWDL